VTSVGRHPRNDIFLDHVTVSRHVELRWEKDDFHVTSPGHGAANSVGAATAATRPPGRSRRCPSTDSGTLAEMGARSEPGLDDPFDEAIDDALSSLPADLRAAMSNVEIVVEDEPPDGQPLLGLYRGVPLPRRSSTYSAVLPDKISIFGGPITRLAAGDAVGLRREVSHVVLHEIAHHFGISDERLIELDRYWRGTDAPPHRRRSRSSARSPRPGIATGSEAMTESRRDPSGLALAGAGAILEEITASGGNAT
jgi:predicted Zn-dependent protease with MMP-like domain